jgi:GTPase
MFVDRAKIYVKGGNGGNGCLAFRREKFVPRGGPSGGDGGNGGSVLLRSSVHLNTLLPFKFQQHLRAQDGGHGSGNRRRGRDGADLIVDVPVGTQVLEESTGQLIADLDQPEAVQVVAGGGRGGRGNAAFATSTNQAPRRHEEGHPGEERVLILELKILADVGLVGYPNAGKSTLISVISAARPKIADYPFTTLVPNLGVVAVGDYGSMVVADIPGLVEGAHEGSGLGDQFLRHVERTRLLVHLVDVSALGPEDPVQAYHAVTREIQLYNPDAEKKPVIVVASKLDAADGERLQRLKEYCQSAGLPFYAISAVTGQGVLELRQVLARQLGVEGN